MFNHYPHWVRRIGWLIVGLVLGWLLHSLPTVQMPQAIAQANPVSQLIQQGLERYQTGDFAGAIAPWQQALSQAATASDRAIIHTNLAQAHRQIGQLDRAIAQWEAAIQIHQATQTEAGQRAVAPLLIEQAQAYSELGQHRQAITLLKTALQLAQTHHDRALEAAAQGGLGSAHAALGNFQEALESYQLSLKLAITIGNPDYQMTALNNLGNFQIRQADRYRFQANSARLEGETAEAQRLTALAEKSRATARQIYTQSWQVSRSLGNLAEATALLNLNRLLEQSAQADDRSQAEQHRDRIESLLIAEPASRAKAYALINLAKSLHLRPLNAGDLQRSRARLDQALSVAQTIGDQRAKSFALGSLGQIDEAAGRWQVAIDWTRQAQFAAQQVNAAESLYLWQWQIGRLLKATGEPERAIAAYQQAIATLQSIRGDIVAANKDFQFNFRDSVEPIYRELMALLLDGVAAGRQAADASLDRLPATTVQSRSETSTGDKALTPDLLANKQPAKSRIQQVLDTLELLKLAEIQNFFGDDCVEMAQSRDKSELTDPQAAMIYTVILPNRTALILKAANGALTYVPIALTTDQMQQEIDLLRNLLEKRSTDEYLPQAQKVYQLLLQPLAAELTALQPATLVFINDGVLRNVPMAALHDGKQFLIQKYAIATTPSLNLTTGGALARDNLRALILGLTVARDPFAPLTYVQEETSKVEEILGGTRLVDQKFTLENLQAQLKQRSYPIVHMATHGKFGVNAESTFLVAYDDQIRLDDIDRLLRTRQVDQPVELLTLSACQTAAGDNRTALGIAGVAVRAGVKSALATLWYINDEATVPLIEAFYSQVRQPHISKAAALRNAQLAMLDNLDYSHPAVWSPFILVGNWL
jgi:CHAT domain-containing protein